ncbi:hypothetical protein OIO90_000967 [Microbotryomycetes sp. JL221]|nr:hypothetical protein OIO90_000967 [Microbotryomycetes sp. JL221]
MASSTTSSTTNPSRQRAAAHARRPDNTRSRHHTSSRHVKSKRTRHMKLMKPTIQIFSSRSRRWTQLNSNHYDSIARTTNQNGMPQDLLDQYGFPTTINVATWNVWSRAKLELKLSNEINRHRTHLIVDTLKQICLGDEQEQQQNFHREEPEPNHTGQGCHIVALQEVDSDFQTLLQNQIWLRQHFVIVTGIGTTNDDDDDEDNNDGLEGVLLLVRRHLIKKGTRMLCSSIRMAPHEQQRRSRREIVGLSLVDDRQIERLRVATIHASALPENENLRQSQFRQCLDLLTNARSTEQTHQSRLDQNDDIVSILLADTNAASEHEFNVFHNQGFRDCHRWMQDIDELTEEVFPDEPIPDIPGLKRRKSETQYEWKRNSPFMLATYPYFRESDSWSRDEYNNSIKRPRDEEEKFRQFPTFGHLFPRIKGASKKRKPRRIDRIFINTLSHVDFHERESDPHERESDFDERESDFEERESDFDERESDLDKRESWRVAAVQQFGQDDFVRDDKRKPIKEKTGKHGHLWPSDHVGVWARLTCRHYFADYTYDEIMQGEPSYTRGRAMEEDVYSGEEDEYNDLHYFSE